MIKTPQTPSLPKDWTKDEDLPNYLRELRLAIEATFQHIHQDFLNGNSQFKVVTEVPTPETLEEGEIVIFQTETSFNLYTKINNIIVVK